MGSPFDCDFGVTSFGRAPCRNPHWLQPLCAQVLEQVPTRVLASTSALEQLLPAPCKNLHWNLSLVLAQVTKQLE